MYIAQAANRECEQLVRVYFHAAIVCGYGLIGELRAEALNLSRASIVE